MTITTFLSGDTRTLINLITLNHLLVDHCGRVSYLSSSSGSLPAGSLLRIRLLILSHCIGFRNKLVYWRSEQSGGAPVERPLPARAGQTSARPPRAPRRCTCLCPGGSADDKPSAPPCGSPTLRQSDFLQFQTPHCGFIHICSVLLNTLRCYTIYNLQASALGLGGLSLTASLYFILSTFYRVGYSYVKVLLQSKKVLLKCVYS